MSGQLEVKYNIYLKNKNRKSASWVLRVRQDGKVKDIPLKTQDPSVAREALERAQFALKAYNYAPTAANLEQVVQVDSEQRNREASVSTVTVREALDAFEVQERRAGVREVTIRTYGRALERILEADGSIRSVTDTDAILSRYDGLSSATRHLYAAALRSFREFLMDKYGISYDPREIPRVHVDPKKAQVQWSINQMRRIIDAVRITVPFKRIPDERATDQMQTYLWLLGTSGMRQAEAYELVWGDLDWLTGSFRLRAETTKARKARTVPVHSYVLERLAREQKTVSRESPGRPTPSDKIFDRIPKTQPGRHEVLHRAIKEANRELVKLGSRELIPVSGLHCLRHSAACLLYSRDEETGALPDIQAVASILWHSPQVSIQYYIRTKDLESNKDMLESKFKATEGMRSNIDDMLDLL